MYELIITTTYNQIRIVVEDYNSPEVREILEQPYIIGVEMHQIKGKTKVRKKGDENVRTMGEEKKD